MPPMEHKISLMVLPALIENNEHIVTKKLKVNVMLDPCSTASYITEKRLDLHGPAQNLNIWDGGVELKKFSLQVTLSISSLDMASNKALSKANELNDIFGNTLATE